MPKKNNTRPSASTRKHFSTRLSQRLQAVPEWIKPVQSLFITKAFFMIILALLLIWQAPVLATVLPYLTLIFLLINGLIMIGSGLMINSRANLGGQTIISLVLGGLSIIVGALPLVLPATFTSLIALMIILGLAFDLLYTNTVLSFLSATSDKQWWIIGSGLIGIITLFNLIFSSLGSFDFWVLFYLTCQGIIYFCAPLFLAKTKK